MNPSPMVRPLRFAGCHIILSGSKSRSGLSKHMASPFQASGIIELQKTMSFHVLSFFQVSSIYNPFIYLLPYSQHLLSVNSPKFSLLIGIVMLDTADNISVFLNMKECHLSTLIFCSCLFILSRMQKISLILKCILQSYGTLFTLDLCLLVPKHLSVTFLFVCFNQCALLPSLLISCVVKY